MYKKWASPRRSVDFSKICRHQYTLGIERVKNHANAICFAPLRGRLISELSRDKKSHAAGAARNPVAEGNIFRWKEANFPGHLQRKLRTSEFLGNVVRPLRKGNAGP